MAVKNRIVLLHLSFNTPKKHSPASSALTPMTVSPAKW